MGAELGQWAILAASAVVGAVGYLLKRAIDRLTDTLEKLSEKVGEHETKIAVHETRLNVHDGRLERAGA